MSSAEESRALRGAASVEPLGEGRYSATLSQFYSVMDHPHGGYLQCVVASAALAEASAQGSKHIHVSALTTNFVNAPTLGAAELRVELRKVGRSVSFVYVAMSQGDELTLESLVTLGTLRDESSVRYQAAPVPDLASREASRQSTGRDDINIMRVLELRLDPATTAGGKVNSPRWVRCAGGCAWTTVKPRGIRGASCSRPTRCHQPRCLWDPRVGCRRCNSPHIYVAYREAIGYALVNG
jgi:hypothetical protein